MRRPQQRNCQQEPNYPGEDTAIFSIRYPDLTAHGRGPDCAIQEPHPIEECGMWAKLGTPVHVNSYGDYIVPGIYDWDTGRIA